MSIPGDQPFRPPRDAGASEAVFRILIVDDDPALRRTFPHALARPGRLFDECGSIGEAIGRLEKQRYALILLDYRLPDANGLALLDWLSDHQRDEAVIIISGEDAIDAAIGALRRGADDYVRKPYHVAQLQRAVDGALHKGTLEKANKLMSQRLKASERLHRYLVESSPDLIFTLDGAGRFTTYNTGIRLFADTTLITNTLYAGFNLSQDLTWTGPSPYQRSSTLTIAGSLAWQVSDGLYLSGEVRHMRAHNELGFGKEAGYATFAGPGIFWQATKQLALSAAYNIQVSGKAKGEPGNLDLTNFSQHLVKVKLGYSF